MRKQHTVYRVMCGRKSHSRWFDLEAQAIKVAIDKGFASIDGRGRTYYSPLSWIEVGRRDRPRSRTIPLRQLPDGKPLPLRNQPTMPDPCSTS